MCRVWLKLPFPKASTEPGAGGLPWTPRANALPARPGDLLNLRDIEQALDAVP